MALGHLYFLLKPYIFKVECPESVSFSSKRPAEERRKLAERLKKNIWSTIYWSPPAGRVLGYDVLFVWLSQIICSGTSIDVIAKAIVVITATISLTFRKLKKKSYKNTFLKSCTISPVTHYHILLQHSQKSVILFFVILHNSIFSFLNKKWVFGNLFVNYKLPKMFKIAANTALSEIFVITFLLQNKKERRCAIWLKLLIL